MSYQISIAMQAVRTTRPQTHTQPKSERNQMKNSQNFEIKSAPLGYYVLEITHDENGMPDQLLRHPIIAWKFDFDEKHQFLIPEPITLGGATDTAGDLQNAPVLPPCGMVRLGNDKWADSEADYLKEQQDEYQAKQKQKG